MKKPTEEKNGVEVTIKNISNIVPYRKALKYIVFFPNVYVDGIDNKVNNTKLKRFNNFAVASEPIDTKILLGNVLYPCNTRLLSISSSDFLRNIESSGIVIKFNVGEISITPNRESIIYSSDTISKIEDRIKAAKAELDTMVSNKFSKDYDNLYEYYKVISHSIYYNPLDNSYVSTKYYRIGGYLSNVDSSTLTFKGSTILRECKGFLRSFFGMKLPNFKGLFYNDRFYQNKIPFNVQDRTKMGEASIILIDSPRLTAAAKSWLQENYNEYTIITSFDKTQFTSYIEANILDLKFYPFKYILIDYMYDYIMSKVKVINLDTNAEFLAYKEELKSNKIPVVKIKDFILYIQRSPDYREKRNFKDINCCIKYIKSLKKGVILADMKESDSWYSIAEARGFVFIRARKEIVDAFHELKPTFLVNKDWVLKGDPTIVKLHTIIESFKDVSMPTNYSSFEILNTVPTPLKSKFKDIINFYYKYSGNRTYMEVASKCTKIDPYVKSMCEKFKDHIEIYNNLSKEVELKIYGEESLKDLLMAAVIVKSKAYRINSKIYDRVKNNKLLRVLCRK
ncbi:protector from prophage-induced early lysis [uncultured phage cr116_1]|uniref:Protector from prophage-induced early lysis n=1 Tax=uncultured phage cr116_1 TaxID=2772073 RepID=A0A7M1RY46_9CAUD|nr:VOG4594 [uncultured phage cr116_1]QOR59365.1 protector from prophage-induced early lysis [uncultured phage cr116_1]